MNLNELEKDLREYRKGSQDKINTEKLWDRVSPHIPQSKKNNYRIFIFFLFPFLILFGSVFWVLNSRSTSVEKSAVLSQHDQSLDKNTSPIFSNENIIATSTTDSKPITQITNQESILSIRNQLNVASSESVNINDQKIVKAENKDFKNVIPRQLFNRDNVIAKDSDAFQKNNSELTLNNKTTFSNKIKNRALLSDSILKDQPSSFVLNKVKTSSPSKTETELFDLSNKNIKSQKSSNSITEEMLERSLLDYALLPLQSMLIYDNEFPSPPKRIYAFQRTAYPKVMVELGGGYFIPSRTLSLENAEFENAFASRSDAEEVLDAWQTSLAFRYMVTPHIGISAGLSYQVLNERSTKELIQSEPLFVEDAVVANFVKLDGTVEPILGDIEVNRTIIKTVSRVNTFKLFQLPIEVVYSHRINRLKLEVGGGVIPNVASSLTGYWHPDNEMEYDLSLDENNYLTSRINMAYTGKIGIAYPLSNSLDVYSNVRYIASLKGFESANYGINQSYNLLGLELGLRVNLFK